MLRTPVSLKSLIPITIKYEVKVKVVTNNGMSINAVGYLY
jgi:hypothetical protein